MERELESKPREVGRVYLYLQLAPLTFSQALPLTGSYTFGRFGTAIAPLGDINQDGFNDVAVGCPFGGDDRGGRVLIFNGRRDVSGQGLVLSQELRAATGPAAGMLPGYGFTLRGGHDLDNNHYPDLIVGAFGVAEVSVYRARAVVSVDAGMVLTPKILNPDDRQCRLPDTNFLVTCLKVKVCAAVSGVGIPDSVDLKVELQLDWLKGTRGGVKRVLFLDSQQPQRTALLKLGHQHPRKCLTYTVYLRAYILLDCGEDNLYLKVELQLDWLKGTRGGVKRVLFLDSQQPQRTALLKLGHQHPRKCLTYTVYLRAYILLDCGEDNLCIPDLKLSASM
ncbi:hypothetical protein CRUP_034626 [Coryphaenoides rupestris]|nr:hypothetical protein CRUP_034626 [Coryphaenoides rupestris]